MAKSGTLRKVQCYHCRVQFEISLRAMTVSCPKCFKKLLVEDVVVNTAQGVTKLQTCGKILIEKKGRVRGDLVEAHGGIEVRGVLEAKAVSGGPVVIRDKAKWRGDCRAPSLTVELGAQIIGGLFEIAGTEGAARFGLSELPGVRNEHAPPTEIA